MKSLQADKMSGRPWKVISSLSGEVSAPEGYAFRAFCPTGITSTSTIRGRASDGETGQDNDRLVTDHGCNDFASEGIFASGGIEVSGLWAFVTLKSIEVTSGNSVIAWYW